MKGLLEALSREALRTDPSPVPWYQTENECSRLYKELCERLSSEDRILLDRLLESNIHETSVALDKKFSIGFKLGLLITAEAFQSIDSFFYDKEDEK